MAWIAAFAVVTLVQNERIHRYLLCREQHDRSAVRRHNVIANTKRAIAPGIAGAVREPVPARIIASALIDLCDEATAVTAPSREIRRV
jgi:hypothetical protein